MDNLAIIIVFYNPSFDQIEQAALLARNNMVIVVDNSCKYNYVAENPKFCYIPLYQNYGIAYAQNIGIREAKNNNAKFILFQDQDSSLSEEQIGQLYNEYLLIQRKDPCIGALGPVIMNRETGKAYKNELGDSITGLVSTVISSGMLVETKTLENVGLMEEDLFIDNVDHEWCWRAQKKGYNIYMTSKSLLYHSVGIDTKRFWSIQIIKSSPVRSYYKFRNNISLIQRKYVPFLWKVKAIGTMLLEYLKYIVCWKEYGAEYIKYATRGILNLKLGNIK